PDGARAPGLRARIVVLSVSRRPTCSARRIPMATRSSRSWIRTPFIPPRSCTMLSDSWQGIAVRLFPSRRQKNRKNRRSPNQSRKATPVLERLEERTMPAVTLANGTGLGYAGIADGSDPPDTCGAAGPNSYIEATNGTIRIFAPKATGTTLATHGIFDFFFNPAIGNETKITPNSFGVADSTILFDNLMGGDGRFIIG